MPHKYQKSHSKKKDKLMKFFQSKFYRYIYERERERESITKSKHVLHWELFTPNVRP